jgi:hypothetical protein
VLGILQPKNHLRSGEGMPYTSGKHSGFMDPFDLDRDKDPTDRF